MKKEIIYVFITLFSAFGLMISCSSDNDNFIDDDIGKEILDLKLSISDGLCTVVSIDTVFYILEGNGGYSVTSSDETIARARVAEDTVYVDFVSNGFTTIEVTDSRG